jgi:hypothetical protein
MMIYCLLIIILIIIILYKNNYIDRYTDYNEYDKYPIATSEGVSYLSNDGKNNVIITHGTTTGTPEYTGVNYKFVDRLKEKSGDLPPNDKDIEDIKTNFTLTTEWTWDTLMKARDKVGGLPRLWEEQRVSAKDSMVSTNRNVWGDRRKKIYDKFWYYHYKKTYNKVKYCSWKSAKVEDRALPCMDFDTPTGGSEGELEMMYRRGEDQLYYDLNDAINLDNVAVAPRETHDGGAGQVKSWRNPSRPANSNRNDEFYKLKVVGDGGWKKYTARSWTDGRTWLYPDNFLAFFGKIEWQLLEGKGGDRKWGNRFDRLLYTQPDPIYSDDTYGPFFKKNTDFGRKKETLVKDVLSILKLEELDEIWDTPRPNGQPLFRNLVDFRNWATYWKDTSHKYDDAKTRATSDEVANLNSWMIRWVAGHPKPDVDKINESYSRVEKKYFSQITNYLTVRVSEKQSTYKYIIKIVTTTDSRIGGSCDLKYLSNNNLQILGTDKPKVNISNLDNKPHYQFGYYQHKQNQITIKTDVTYRLTYAHYNNTLYTATVVPTASTGWNVQIKKSEGTHPDATVFVTFEKEINIHLLHVTEDSIYLITSVVSADEHDANIHKSEANIHKFPNTTDSKIIFVTENNGSTIKLQNNKQIIDYDIGPETDNIIIVQ